ncbi:MAG: hypothetical protein JRN68_05425 [Nitrososphaerota archaeon]|nr:hypothetical protein [Nitrososphaerota archaeon]
MEQPSGALFGVFGSEPERRMSFLNSIAKRSETEGLIVYHRVSSGSRYTFLNDAHYPARIQGASRVASLCSYAYYIFPMSGKLTLADGEVAILLDAFELPGTVELIDIPIDPSNALNQLKGTRMADYGVESRASAASNIDLPRISPSPAFATGGTLLYVDRVFTVKGVGTVVLGFVLSGTISLHDELRPLPEPDGKMVEVKGIQVNDVDFPQVGPGIRVGLSIKGATPEDLQKTAWLDSGNLETLDAFSVKFRQNRFYKDQWSGKSLHLQLPGEFMPVKAEGESGGEECSIRLNARVPVWNGMKVCLIDLNAKGSRIVGSGTFLA